MAKEVNIPDISHAPIESWEVGRIKPYPLNNKIHSPKQVTSLARSIESQGLNDPITVDKEGVIIAGHGRLEAVKILGWTHVPIRHLHMLTKEQADKLRIAANKTASTDYDWDALQREIIRLSQTGTDMTDIGFDEKELTMLAGDIGELDLGSVADDIAAEVESFEEETRESAKKAEGDEIPLVKAFGFNRLPIHGKRVVTKFMAHIESKTGLQGSEALMRFMEAYTSDK